MDIVKAFADNEETADINIQGTYDFPLFQANQIGKILGLANIRATITIFDDDEKVVNIIDTLGGNQEVTFLTELGLYRLLGMSRKPVARKFQKWVATVIREIRLTGKYESEKSIKQQIEENKKEYEQKIELTRHKTLIETNRNKNGVYAGKVKTLGDSIIIKLGNTSDLKLRAYALHSTFGSFMLMDFFPCNRHIALETAILKHPSIQQYAYTEPINGVVSTETFCIPNNYYTEMIAIINYKVRELNDETVYQIELAEKQQKILDTQLEITNRNIEMLKLQATLPPSNHVIEKTLTVQEVPQPIPFTINERRLNSRGHKIQKYTLDGKLVATYSGMRDTTRKEIGSSDNGIKHAILNNTIYHGHRWLFLERCKDDNTVQDIGESVAVRLQNSGLVAMISIDKTHIVQVFPDQKSAGKARQFSSAAAISQAIKLNRLCSGHYFCYYNDCSEDMKSAYLQHSDLPGEPARCNAFPIKQLHPITRVLIKTHNSIADVQKEYQASRITLKKAIAEGTVFKGFAWSY